MINDKTDEVIKELFDSLKNRYQFFLESIKGSESVFNYVQSLYYKCHKINPNRGGSYIDCFHWIKNKKKTLINPINQERNKCFQYAVTVALNHEEIEKVSQRINERNKFSIKKRWWEKN